MEAKKYYVTAFYEFIHLPEESLEELKSYFLQLARDHKIEGLMILASEGVNSTISCESQESMRAFCEALEKKLGLEEVFYKYSESPRQLFLRFSVKIRPEIVTLHRPDVFPDLADQSHLSPEEWDQKLKSEKPPIVLDTRNTYETEIGKFKGAIAPPITDFSEFPNYLREANLPKDQEILIYCTGGIRCEKAIYEMRDQGFKKVYQLYGGILNYLEQFPNSTFEGECFVFDRRLAVDQNLNATEKYHLCPMCGQTATEVRQCENCGDSTYVCDPCWQEAQTKHACSKNCAYHLRRKAGQLTKVRAAKIENRPTMMG